MDYEIVLEITPDEDDPVFLWRIEQLERAGYDAFSAVLLARSDVDLHLALALRAKGCPASTAVRILN
jgi:hypothetical protein